MGLVQKILAACQENPLRIAVLGDSMIDHWQVGHFATCQDGCSCFKIEQERKTPGGAANAALQLDHWPGCDVKLLSFFDDNLPFWNDLDDSVTQLCLEGYPMSVKRRSLVDDKIVHREDVEVDLSGWPLENGRQRLLDTFHQHPWDAVLISDYNKGYFDDATIKSIVAQCVLRGIYCVADAKRPPSVYEDAIIKGNEAYFGQWAEQARSKYSQAVTTFGAHYPVMWNQGEITGGVDAPPVYCRNHVGAGDCFAAHLTLALAAGVKLYEAARFAHAAGRVYVQHPFSRPPWPHEIARDLDPVAGKQVDSSQLAALRQSNRCRIVFTNGVYRLPHCGHAFLLDWAKKQGDILVVGINDDDSASRLRYGKFVLPLPERVRHLAGFSAVDWIVPFTEGNPCAIIDALKPDVLVKGVEYQGKKMPGADQVPEVRLCPMLGEWHASDLEDYRD